MSKKHQIKVSSKAGRSRSHRKWRRQAKVRLYTEEPLKGVGLCRCRSKRKKSNKSRELKGAKFCYDNRMTNLLIGAGF